LELKEASTFLAEHQTLAKVEKPLVVHIRLGDYKMEENFGILSEKYYECLNELWEGGSFGKIWMFSDEPEIAIEKIPKKLRGEVRIINDKSEVPAVTLEVMRLGHGYVIANSSLSWWGAMLSKNTNPIVIPPNPWFKSMPEPKNLIPEGWDRRFGF